MTTTLPDDRLVYDGQASRLVAYRGGAQLLVLPAGPADLPVAVRHALEIDWWPVRGREWLREPDRPWRDMSPTELRAVRGWLDRLITGARTAHLEPEGNHG